MTWVVRLKRLPEVITIAEAYAVYSSHPYHTDLILNHSWRMKLAAPFPQILVKRANGNHAR